MACTIDACDDGGGQCVNDASTCAVCADVGEPCQRRADCCAPWKCGGKKGAKICR